MIVPSVCGTVMIYCGSGSDFGQVWLRFRFRFRIKTIFSTVFKQQFFIIQNLVFSMTEAALFPRKLASHFYFFDLKKFHFTLIPVPLRQKVTVSAVPVHNSGRG